MMGVEYRVYGVWYRVEHAACRGQREGIGFIGFYMGIGFRVKDRALGVESFESLEGSEIGFKVQGVGHKVSC